MYRRAPRFFGASGSGSGARVSAFFSTLSGLLISLASVMRGILLRVGFGLIWSDQVADLARGPRQIEACLGDVGQGVDARVTGGGERGLGVVDLDRRRHAGLE